jgi:hypothetical protein
LLVRILAPETGRPLELADARVERAILMVGRAVITEADMRVVGEPLHDGLRDARFAYTRLT